MRDSYLENNCLYSIYTKLKVSLIKHYCEVMWSRLDLSNAHLDQLKQEYRQTPPEVLHAKHLDRLTDVCVNVPIVFC